jgi:hypothetical protein
LSSVEDKVGVNVGFGVGSEEMEEGGVKEGVDVKDIDDGLAVMSISF